MSFQANEFVGTLARVSCRPPVVVVLVAVGARLMPSEKVHLTVHLQTAFR